MKDRDNTNTAVGQGKYEATQQDPRRLGRGHKRPIVQHPTPNPEPWTDPSDFAQALDLHMRRHGDSSRHLAKAITGKREKFNDKTLRFWRLGQKQPSSLHSFAILARIEKRYRLEPGYFKAKLPKSKRSATGVKLKGHTNAERRRIRWHLPDDFDRRPPMAKEEILNWIDNNILRSTDYRKYQALSNKQRFGLRFKSIKANEGPPQKVGSAHPSLLAPHRLQAEMEALLKFKTSTLTEIGKKRSGVWNGATADQKIEHFGLFFGALTASPDSEVGGLGIPSESLTFAMMVFPQVWDWYLLWRERKRGFYTTWETDMLNVAQSLTRSETGWFWQNPSLADHLQAVPGLITEDDVSRARTSWQGLCEEFLGYAAHRQKEIERVAKVHRDPFEPILVILEADSPLAEYRKITEQIYQQIPDRRRYPIAAAETVRAFLMLRIGLHSGLRQKNLRQLLFTKKADPVRSERALEDLKRGELRWDPKKLVWELFIPATAFKNADSSYFGSAPFRLELPNVHHLYDMLDEYLATHRPRLLKGVTDPGTLFVKTIATRSSSAEYSQTGFYEAWRYIIERYGIFNPYTGRGAVPGLKPHGPHNIRDVLATHVLKVTGSYEQASYAIQDTPDMVKSHYGRFLPHDKAAMAAKVLNRAWTDDD